MKKKSKKLDKAAKASEIVLVSRFHSDEEEPWVYENRASKSFVGHPMLDIRAAIANAAPMRWM
jgi:predicted metallo-beta-lactamase superfamily hydrolase